MFEALEKIFYKSPKEHKKTYEQRFLCSQHLDIEIKQFNHNKAYPAFYYYHEELVKLLEKIFFMKENLSKLVKEVPSVMLYQFELSCIVEEVQSTSAIEGVNSTRRELKEILEENSSSRHFSSIIKKYSILASKANINFNTCEDIRKFYDEFAHQEIIHENPNHKLDGKVFRTEAADIISAGKIIHRGLHPEKLILEAMDYALCILHDENIPILIRIAIFHYLFVYIHPFYDGNGRTARFISSFYLARYFHYLPALRLSLNIKKQRSNYYKLIKNTDAEINCGDLTPFIYGFLFIVYETFEDIKKILNRKLEQLEMYRKKIISPDKELYDILLQASMFFGQGVSMNDLMKITGKSRNTIKARLNAMPKEHLVIRQNKKNFYKLNMMLFK